MRGQRERSGSLFSYVWIEERIPASQPLRRIRTLADQALDRPGQDRRRCLPSNRGDPADLPPLEAAVRRHTCKGGQKVDPVGEGKRSPLEAFDRG